MSSWDAIINLFLGYLLILRKKKEKKKGKLGNKSSQVGNFELFFPHHYYHDQLSIWRIKGQNNSILPFFASTPTGNCETKEAWRCYDFVRKALKLRESIPIFLMRIENYTYLWPKILLRILNGAILGRGKIVNSQGRSQHVTTMRI